MVREQSPLKLRAFIAFEGQTEVTNTSSSPYLANLVNRYGVSSLDSVHYPCSRAVNTGVQHGCHFVHPCRGFTGADIFENGRRHGP